MCSTMKYFLFLINFIFNTFCSTFCQKKKTLFVVHTIITFYSVCTITPTMKGKKGCVHCVDWFDILIFSLVFSLMTPYIYIWKTYPRTISILRLRLIRDSTFRVSLIDDRFLRFLYHLILVSVTHHSLLHYHKRYNHILCTSFFKTL